jgi:hypothetical protein
MRGALCRLSGFIATAVLAVTLTACGGNPAGPSEGVVLRGTVVGATALGDRASASSAGSATSGGRITVTLQEDPTVTTTVSGNGTFELAGLPDGSFTLVFSSEGVTLGTITISADAGDEVQITVQVTSTTVILISIEVVGSDDDDEGEDEDDGDAAKTCMINGGKVGQKIELEGNVNGAPGSTFKLKVNGNRARSLVDVNAGGASWKCNGKSGSGTCNATSLKDGSKVHVSGNLDACTMDSAMVMASKVMIQK